MLPCFTRSSLVVVLCAGMAWGAGPQPGLTVTKGAGGASVGFAGGGVFRTTTGRVVGPRLIGVEGTAIRVAIWDEVGGAGPGHWYAVSLDGAAVDVVRPTENLVRLRYASFDPAAGVPPVPAELSAPAGAGLYLVQFVTTPLQAYRDAVTAAGGSVAAFLTDQTHVVAMDAGARDAVAALPFVRWVGPYHPAYKLDESLIAALQVPGAGEGARRYSIECWERGPGAQGVVAQKVAALGGAVHITSPDGFRMEATVTPAQALELARLDEVSFIDPWGPGETDMDNARKIGGAVPVLSDAGFTGQGVRAEVFDTGVRTTHQAFQNPAILLHKGNSGDTSHGTSTYGINFGNGAANQNGTGMLPDREQGIFFPYTQCTQFGGQNTRLAMNLELVDPGGPFRAVFQSSSIGSPLSTTYTTISAEVDDYLFITDLLSCQSQSNAGSQQSRPQAWAKNIVSVGGVNHKNTLTKTDDSASGASFGPAADGRVKPDLAHFYESILCTSSQSDTSYTTDFGGTSGATPITAGHFGLLFQMWHSGVFEGFGGKSTVFESRAKMATAKALMLNTASPYDWTKGGQNGSLTRARQGWGMADLGSMFNVRTRMFIIDETEPVTPLGKRTYKVNVAGGEPALRATMAYTDLKGTVGAQQARINDLTLKVTAPDGTVYYGNNGLTAGVWSTPNGVPNKVDTVENVFVQSPAAGAWTVEVSGDEIVQDSRPETEELDADFALVVSGVTVSKVCYADCNKDGELDIDDFVCFQNAFSLKLLSADCDQNGLHDVDDFICFQTSFGIGCP